MPGVKVSDLRKKKKRLTVEHEDDVFEFDYAPNRYDDDVHEKITTIDPTDKNNASKLLAEVITAMVIWWNLEEEDGSMTPITHESLRPISIRIKDKMVTAIMSDVSNRGNDKSSPDSSQPAEKPDPVPIGTA